MSNVSLKKSTAIISAVVIAVVFLGIGMLSAKYIWPSQPAARNMGGQGGSAYGGQGGQFGQGRMGRGGGMAAGTGFISGELIKKDATSMSVKLRDGSMKLVVLTPSTKAMQMTEGKMDDVAIGAQIMVSGNTNTDGSVTAQTVQVRPTAPPQAAQPDQKSAQPPAGQQPPQQP